MNSEEEILVGSRTKNVGDEPELEREERGVSEGIGVEYLQRYNKGDNVFGKRFGSAEFRDLYW